MPTIPSPAQIRAAKAMNYVVSLPNAHTISKNVDAPHRILKEKNVHDSKSPSATPQQPTTSTSKNGENVQPENWENNDSKVGVSKSKRVTRQSQRVFEQTEDSMNNATEKNETHLEEPVERIEFESLAAKRRKLLTEAEGALEVETETSNRDEGNDGHENDDNDFNADVINQWVDDSSQLTTKGKLLCTSFSSKYMFSCRLNRGLDDQTIQENLNRGLNRRMEIDYQDVMRVVEKLENPTKELGLVVLAQSALINKLERKIESMETLMTKNLVNNSKQSFNINLLPDMRFSLPNGFIYIISSFFREKKALEPLTKLPLNKLGNKFIRIIFKTILEDPSHRALVMTPLMDSSKTVKWVPIADEAIDMIIEALIICTKCENHPYVTSGVLRSSMRNSLYNLLDTERGNVRKVPGGSQKLEFELEELRKTINETNA